MIGVLGLWIVHLVKAARQMIPPSIARASASPVFSISMRSAKTAHHPPENSPILGLEQPHAHSNPMGA
jgi:hypothetical protein